MESLSPKSAVVKVGTDVLTDCNGHLDTLIIASLCSQLARVKQHISRLVLISSGAVAAGRERYGVVKRVDESKREKQKYFTAGQPRLIATYDKSLAPLECVANEIQATKDAFLNRRSYRELRGCLEAVLESKSRSLPIVNENDAVATDELMFTDNDQLAGFVASMIRAEVVLILTSVNGVLADINDPDSVVSTIDPLMDDWHSLVVTHKSRNGTGGMASKCQTASRLARRGITVRIANGKVDGVIERVLINQERLGTEFVARPDCRASEKYSETIRGV